MIIRSLCIAGLALAAIAVPAADTPAKAREELRSLSADLKRLSRVFSLVHEVVAPSVVALHTRTQEPARRLVTPFGGVLVSPSREVEIGEGSGFIVKSDANSSWLVTNAHVVVRGDGSGSGLARDRAGRPIPYDRIAVELNDGRLIDAEYVGVSIETDLAVMRIPLGNQTAVEWADSDQAHVGDWVVALGYPLGVGYSATSGIISATDRSTGIYEPVGGFESFIQTDAAINPGNSGGPLVDISGRIVGVNSSIKSGTGANIGLGFAIPSNLAHRVTEDLLTHGTVRWPAIGVELLPPEQATQAAISAGLPPTSTAIIAGVLDGSPAAKGGLRKDDVVIGVGGVHVQGQMQFRTRLATCRVDEPVELTVWRGGREISAKITPINRADIERVRKAVAQQAIADQVTLPGFGMSVALDGQPGAVITQIDEDGLAAQAALAPGMRILKERTIGALGSKEHLTKLAKRQEIVIQVAQEGSSETEWLRMRR